MRKISGKGRRLNSKNDKIIIASEEESVSNTQEQLDMPRRSPRNTETLASTNVPTPGFDSVRIDHTPEPRGGLKALQDKGLRITSYVETDGSGAPITRRRYDDDE